MQADLKIRNFVLYPKCTQGYRRQVSKIQANEFNSHFQTREKEFTSLLNPVTLFHETTTSK